MLAFRVIGPGRSVSLLCNFYTSRPAPGPEAGGESESTVHEGVAMGWGRRIVLLLQVWTQNPVSIHQITLRTTDVSNAHLCR